MLEASMKAKILTIAKNCPNSTTRDNAKLKRFDYTISIPSLLLTPRAKALGGFFCSEQETFDYGKINLAFPLGNPKRNLIREIID